MEDLPLTVDEVARILRVSRQTIYVLCREGKLPHFKVGTKLRRAEEHTSELQSH